MGAQSWKDNGSRSLCTHEREMQNLSVGGRRKLLAHPFSASMLAPPGAAFRAHLVLSRHWQTERL